MTRHLLAAGLMFLAALAMSGPLSADTKVVPESRAQVELSFAPVVRQVAPAVVNIYAKRMVAQRPISPLFDDPFFKRFFGENFGRFGRPREREQNSLGSGVIVDEAGLVVTNHHVIQGATEITVVLSDRREFPARRRGAVGHRVEEPRPVPERGHQRERAVVQDAEHPVREILHLHLVQRRRRHRSSPFPFHHRPRPGGLRKGEHGSTA